MNRFRRFRSFAFISALTFACSGCGLVAYFGTGRVAIPGQWRALASTVDRYNASEDPQPVCVRSAGLQRVLTFTNYDYYPSKSLSNNRNAIRVGELKLPVETYSLLSSYTPSDPHSLQGQRQRFATAVVPDQTFPNERVFIFGGMKGSVESNEFHLYTPGLGFSYAGIMPTIGSVTGYRTSMVAAAAAGRIYLFGGQWGAGSITNQIVRYDPATGGFTLMLAMPAGFYGARAVTKRVGGNDYIYITGAIVSPGGNRTSTLYRYDVNQNKFMTVISKPGSAPVQPVPYAAPTIALDHNGEVRIIVAGGYSLPGPTWSRIDTFVVNDTYGGANDGHAFISKETYNLASRARDLSGAVRCGPNMYLLGGTFGGGPNWHTRDTFLDRLGEPVAASGGPHF